MINLRKLKHRRTPYKKHLMYSSINKFYAEHWVEAHMFVNKYLGKDFREILLSKKIESFDDNCMSLGRS